MKHKKTTIAIIVIAVLIIAFLISNYNSLNNYREKANNEYSNLSIIIDKKWLLGNLRGMNQNIHT